MKPDKTQIKLRYAKIASQVPQFLEQLEWWEGVPDEAKAVIVKALAGVPEAILQWMTKTPPADSGAMAGSMFGQMICIGFSRTSCSEKPKRKWWLVCLRCGGVWEHTTKSLHRLNLDAGCTDCKNPGWPSEAWRPATRRKLNCG